MKKAIVIVEKGDDGKYWCRAEIGNCGFNSCGKTVDKAKDSLQKCMEEAKQEGDIQEVPELEYKYDLQSFFNYFSFLNVNEVARRAGINPSLMRQYSCGAKNAGEKTYQRLSSCMSKITTELQAARF